MPNETNTIKTVAEKIRQDYMSRKFLLAFEGMTGYLAYCFIYKVQPEPVGIAAMIAAYGLIKYYGERTKNGG